jgi:hypothetical protein
MRRSSWPIIPQNSPVCSTSSRRLRPTKRCESTKETRALTSLLMKSVCKQSAQNIRFQYTFRITGNKSQDVTSIVAPVHAPLIYPRAARLAFPDPGSSRHNVFNRCLHAAQLLTQSRNRIADPCSRDGTYMHLRYCALRRLPPGLSFLVSRSAPLFKTNAVLRSIVPGCARQDS